MNTAKLEAKRTSGNQVEFQLADATGRYVAYGTYVSDQEYSVDHGPDQYGLERICGALDYGMRVEVSA